MSIDPDLEASRRATPRAHLLKFMALGAIVAVGFAALRFTPLREQLTGPALEALLANLRGNPWAPFALLAAFVVLLPFGVPASPLMLAGGIVFGAWVGSLLNFVGVFVGGAITFWLGRTLGRGFVEQLGGKRLKRLEKRIARGSFWSLVGLRFLPFPYTLLNYAQALVGIRPSQFFASTAIGTAPPILLYTWFAAELSHAVGGERQAVLTRMGLALLALAAVIFVPRLIVGLKRRKRLAALRRVRERKEALRLPESYDLRVKVGEILRRLQTDGWYLVATSGSHRQFKHASKPGRVTVPGKPSDDLAPGTLNSILKQAGLK